LTDVITTSTANSQRINIKGSRMFFFSSRRRHTRSYGDWSSDVCSSDLYEFTPFGFSDFGCLFEFPEPIEKLSRFLFGIANVPDVQIASWKRFPKRFRMASAFLTSRAPDLLSYAKP